MVRQDTLRNRARGNREKKLCPESRRSHQIRELASRRNRNLVFALLVAAAAVFVSSSAVFELIFFIYFPPRDNVSLLRALKAISEFVVDRLLVQFINLFYVSFSVSADARIYFRNSC